MPTAAQAFAAIFVCQMISNLLRNIYLFRYDTRSQNIYIVAGRGEDGNEESFDLEVYPDGNWEFNNE